MLRLILVILCVLPLSAAAQNAPMQAVLQEHAEIIVKSTRKTVAPAIAAVADSGLPQAQDVLQAWQAKNIWRRAADGLFFRAEKVEGKTYRLFDFDTGEYVGEAEKSELNQIKPNSGIRGLLAVALVQFQLSDPDLDKRRDALLSLERDPKADALAPLRGAIDTETDPTLRANKMRLERFLTIAFDADEASRVAAIKEMSGDLGVDVRATLNPLVETRLTAVAGEPDAALNVARELMPGSDVLSASAAYDLLVAQGAAPPRIDQAAIREALAANIEDHRVGGVRVADLDTEAARREAYDALAVQGIVPSRADTAERDDTLADYRFFEVYADPSPAVTAAAEAALKQIATRPPTWRSTRFRWRRSTSSPPSGLPSPSA